MTRISKPKSDRQIVGLGAPMQQTSRHALAARGSNGLTPPAASVFLAGSRRRSPCGRVGPSPDPVSGSGKVEERASRAS